MRKGYSEAVKVAIEMNVEAKRGRGRLKKRWMDRIDNDMKLAGESK